MVLGDKKNSATIQCVQVGVMQSDMPRQSGRSMMQPWVSRKRHETSKESVEDNMKND